MRGAGQSGERRSLCVRAENPAITANGSGVRGPVTGAAYHGATIILTVQPDASELAGAEGRAEPPEAGSAVTVEVRDEWIIPQAISRARHLVLAVKISLDREWCRFPQFFKLETFHKFRLMLVQEPR